MSRCSSRTCDPSRHQRATTRRARESEEGRTPGLTLGVAPRFYQGAFKAELSWPLKGVNILSCGIWSRSAPHPSPRGRSFPRPAGMGAALRLHLLSLVVRLDYFQWAPSESAGSLSGIRASSRGAWGLTAGAWAMGLRAPRLSSDRASVKPKVECSM